MKLTLWGMEQPQESDPLQSDPRGFFSRVVNCIHPWRDVARKVCLGLFPCDHVLPTL